MSDDLVAMLDEHRLMIEEDAESWIERHKHLRSTEWGTVLRCYAAHCAEAQRTRKQSAQVDWCARYGLEVLAPVSQFLYELCHTTLKDVEENETGFAARLVELAGQVAELRAQVNEMRRPHRPPEIVDYHFGTPAAEPASPKCNEKGA